jgi:hypothetical protein
MLFLDDSLLQSHRILSHRSGQSFIVQMQMIDMVAVKLLERGAIGRSMHVAWLSAA